MKNNINKIIDEAVNKALNSVISEALDNNSRPLPTNNPAQGFQSRQNNNASQQPNANQEQGSQQQQPNSNAEASQENGTEQQQQGIINQQGIVDKANINIKDFCNPNENNPISNALLRLAKGGYLRNRNRVNLMVRELQMAGY